jgi:hypothetical protein
MQQGEWELELEEEFEHHESAHKFEMKDEFETGEQFFGRVKKLAGRIGRFVSKAAPGRPLSPAQSSN